MIKEPYVKPEVRSETMEPEALGCYGSGAEAPFKIGNNPSAAFCCQDSSAP